MSVVSVGNLVIWVLHTEIRKMGVGYILLSVGSLYAKIPSHAFDQLKSKAKLHPRFCSQGSRNLSLDAKSETLSKFDLLGQYGAREVFDQYMEKSTLENGKLGFKCTLCGKEMSHLNNLRNHIESAHFPGHFSYNCNHCEKTFKNKNSLCSHMSQMHRGQNL